MAIPDQSKWVGVAPTDPPQSIPATVDFEHVNNKQAFLVGGVAPAVVAKYTLAQLVNPVGSGVIMYVTKALICSLDTAVLEQYRLTYHNTLLANAIRTGRNKYSGEPVGQGAIRYENNAVIPGLTVSYKCMDSRYVRPEWLFNPPIRLDAEKGIVLVIETLNIRATFHFEWFEL